MKWQDVRLTTDSFSQHNQFPNRHLIEGPLDLVWHLLGRDSSHICNSAEESPFKKVIGIQLVEKIPAFSGTRKNIISR